ncbi:helix-turn-helix domain-containing protein [Bacillus sp. FJAT-28004]|uniref:helix-turn-helix domain-containing protein n=1 Tax=Bacillus sp. FJAT-28004 TaxID=1679165 RepID=UPI0006B4A733|nr:helix-turn-helix transcriptional regulator [Bacillus sp. FJAT-28004]
MTAGTFMKICREQAGISQVKLARLLNRTQSCISKLEKDQKTWDIHTFRDWTKITNQAEAGIAFLYGVDPASILQTVLQISGAA